MDLPPLLLVYETLVYEGADDGRFSELNLDDAAPFREIENALTNVLGKQSLRKQIPHNVQNSLSDSNAGSTA